MQSLCLSPWLHAIVFCAYSGAANAEQVNNTLTRTLVASGGVALNQNQRRISIKIYLSQVKTKISSRLFLRCSSTSTCRLLPRCRSTNSLLPRCSSTSSCRLLPSCSSTSSLLQRCSRTSIPLTRRSSIINPLLPSLRCTMIQLRHLM